MNRHPAESFSGNLEDQKLQEGLEIDRTSLHVYPWTYGWTHEYFSRCLLPYSVFYLRSLIKALISV